METPVTPYVIDLTGQKFGKLTVVGLVPNQAARKIWLCHCVCGQTAICLGSNLKTGNSTSCGCSRKKHGLSHTKVHHVWRTMLDRCINPNATQYADYGGRGITVCESWQDFTVFFEDMGWPPRGGTLDRINNDGPYCKENCKWSTHREQARNKRNTRLITVFGQTKSVTEWAMEKGMPPRTLFNRLFRAKMTPEDAVTAPLYAQQRKSRR